jgi:hypothetical protein
MWKDHFQDSGFGGTEDGCDVCLPVRAFERSWNVWKPSKRELLEDDEILKYLKL